MLHNCRLIIRSNVVELQHLERRTCLRFDSASNPSIDSLRESCLVDYDDAVSRPGYIEQHVVLDDSYAKRSWRWMEHLQHFFGWQKPIRNHTHHVANNRPIGWPFVMTTANAAIKSSDETPSKKPIVDHVDDVDDVDDPVKKVKGRMIWSHKTAPELEIEGQGSPIDPDGIAAGRRR